MSEKNREPNLIGENNIADEKEKNTSNGGDKEVENVSPKPYKLHLNTYATQKTVVAGVMNVSLLTSNSNQVKLIVNAANMGKRIVKRGAMGETTVHSENGWDVLRILVVSLLAIAIVLQFISAIFIISMARSKAYSEPSKHEHDQSNRSLDRNNKILLGITSAVTFMNVVAVAINN